VTDRRDSLGLADDTAWFTSKVDWWLAPILLLVPLISAGVLVVALVEGEGVWISLVTILLIGAIYGGLVWPMRYGISSSTLIVRHGLVRHTIPLEAIREVKPTRNPLSSPALSLDRLAIRYGEGFFRSIMISPADRDQFLALLSRRSGLTRDGDAQTWTSPDR
jgi:hypothetical protein